MIIWDSGHEIGLFLHLFLKLESPVQGIFLLVMRNHDFVFPKICKAYEKKSLNEGSKLSRDYAHVDLKSI